MKLGTTLFALSIGIAAITGCAVQGNDEDNTPTQDEQTTKDDADSEENLGKAVEALTTCKRPPPGTCAKAFSICRNPRLGGTYCWIADQCTRCFP